MCHEFTYLSNHPNVAQLPFIKSFKQFHHKTGEFALHTVLAFSFRPSSCRCYHTQHQPRHHLCRSSQSQTDCLHTQQTIRKKVKTLLNAQCKFILVMIAANLLCKNKHRLLGKCRRLIRVYQNHNTCTATAVNN